MPCLPYATLVCPLPVAHSCLLQSSFVAAAGQQIKHCHAHRNSVCHLIQNQRTTAVGNLRSDLDAAVHRTRMHHDRVRRSAFQVLGLQSVSERHTRASKEKMQRPAARVEFGESSPRPRPQSHLRFASQLADPHRQVSPNSSGTSVPGPAILTFAPSFVSRCTFDRATRE